MNTPEKITGARARVVGVLVQKNALRGSAAGTVGMRILLDCGKGAPLAAYAWGAEVVAKLIRFKVGETLHVRGELRPYIWTARDGGCDGFSMRLRITSVAGFTGKGGE